MLTHVHTHIEARAEQVNWTLCKQKMICRDIGIFKTEDYLRQNNYNDNNKNKFAFNK